MACPTIHIVSFAPEPAPVSWLHLVSPPGPRSPRTRSSTMGLSGPVTSTETNWTDAGCSATDYHVKHLLARRKALIGTLRHLRSKHKATSLAMTDLQDVTLQLLALGVAGDDGDTQGRLEW